MELHTGVVCVQVLYYRHMYLVSDMHGKCNCLSQFPLFRTDKIPFPVFCKQISSCRFLFMEYNLDIQVSMTGKSSHNFFQSW